jgi:hypothetical protein
MMNYIHQPNCLALAARLSIRPQIQRALSPKRTIMQRIRGALDWLFGHPKMNAE